MREAVVAVVFASAIAGLYWRPPHVREWHIASIAAVVAWLTSPLSLRAGIQVLRNSWSIEAFFLGLMLIAAGTEALGLYVRAAQLLSRFRPGRPRVLAATAAGTAITTVLSNDATPLILAPAVFAAGGPEVARDDAAFATTLIGDAASLLLPMSNPVGLLFHERAGIAFGRWLAWILPAAVAGAAIVAATLWWRAGPPDRSNSEPAARLRAMTWSERAAVALFAGLAVAYVWAGIAGVQLGLVTLGGGLVLLAIAVAGQNDMRPYRRTSPGLLIFVAALLLLVRCASASGLLDGLDNTLSHLAGQPAIVAIAGAAIVGLVLANVMNNWPAAVVLVAIIPADGAGHTALASGALIGCTLGANLTIAGSLSTLFWLGLSRQSGARYTGIEYLRRAWLPALASCVAACLVAALVIGW